MEPQAHIKAAENVSSVLNCLKTVEKELTAPHGKQDPALKGLVSNCIAQLEQKNADVVQVAERTSLPAQSPKDVKHVIAAVQTALGQPATYKPTDMQQMAKLILALSAAIRAQGPEDVRTPASMKGKVEKSNRSADGGSR